MRYSGVACVNHEGYMLANGGPFTTRTTPHSKHVTVVRTGNPYRALDTTTSTRFDPHSRQLMPQP